MDYKWTFNITINPIHWFMVIVWIGDTCYQWQIRKPLTLRSGNEAEF
jgi:uncharacterized membrane protein